MNDNSLCGQFTEDIFEQYMREDILPILKQLDEIGAVLWKEYETYAKYITENRRLIDYIHIRGNPVWDKLKEYLLKLSSEEPFWNDAIKTKPEKEYQCEFSVIPNCLTEAFERKGMLLSFKESGFERKNIGLYCDGSEYLVRNFFAIEGLKEILEELGVIITWKKNSFFVSSIQCKFEIRFQEDHHNKPHFHLTNTEKKSVSVSIPDADILAGSISNLPKVISWSLQNMLHIKELWNRIHPEKSIK